MKTVTVKWSVTLEDGTKKAGEVEAPQIEPTDIAAEWSKDCPYDTEAVLALANRQIVTDHRNDAAREAKSGPAKRVEVTSMVAMLMAAPFNKTKEDAEAAVRAAMGK